MNKHLQAFLQGLRHTLNISGRPLLSKPSHHKESLEEYLKQRPNLYRSRGIMTTPIKEDHILWLSTEDFELLGFDMSKLNQDTYDFVLDYLRDHFNENFTDALKEALADYEICTQMGWQL